MNIAFMGVKAGKSAVSYNLLAISTMAAVKYNLDVSVMQSNYDMNRIENAFMPVSSMICMKEDFAYYKRQGIDEMIDGIIMRREGDLYEDALVKVNNTTLSYLPSTSETSSCVYERECEKVVDTLSSIIRKGNRITFVDCGVGKSVIDKNFLEKSDLIVVNLEQDNQPITKEMSEDRSFMEKCVFVVGRYDSDSRYNLRTIKSKYRIDGKSICAIPYNISFKDSVLEGRLVDFINRNIDCEIYDDNYEFISGVDFATRMVLRKAGCNV